MATADWNPLGEVYLRKTELYSMGWADIVDLNKFVAVASCQYGGPIALLRDDAQTARVQVSTKPVITTYTAAGYQIGQMRWNSGQIVKMGWTVTEDLLCVQDDGVVLVYDFFLNFKRTFGMGQEAKDVKVIDCQIFNSFQGTGIAILTSTFRIFIINSVDDPRIRRLAEVPGLQTAPSSWTIINLDRQSRALVAKGKELYLIDHGGQFQYQSPQISAEVNEYVMMSVSYSNKYLAMFTDSGVIWIGSSDLQKCYCEFNTKSPQCPQQLAWCGSGAVVAMWDKIMLVVGPDKDWIKFQFDSPVHLTQEDDGLRIIQNYQHEFLHKVPDVTEKIFKIGSMEPGAMLYEANREFMKGSQKADEYVRMIKDKLDIAVDQCIQASGHELEPTKQKQLLRAASFGKCFLTDYNPQAFVDMCQMLRVLNQVRNHVIGIPLTYTQLEKLTTTVLIDRLVLRKFFAYAIKISQYLKIPEAEGSSRILAHWACYKVKQKNQDDEIIARAIAQKLGDTPGVSYSEVANEALECGREELAIRLLDYEPRAAHQVPLLMKMHKDQIALSKAIESGDTDLVYTVLLRLKESMTQGDFLMSIRSMPISYSLFLQYCRQQNPKLLEDLYYQEDNFIEEGNCKVMRSFDDERLDDRTETLNQAIKCYQKGRHDFVIKQTEDQIKLLKYQRRLEEEFNRPYMDLSLHQTIYRLTVENNYKVSEQLRKEFKVPDRRYWWIRIQGLAEAGEWVELDKFSRNKKPPVGMEAFVEVCAKHHNVNEAMKYMSRVSPEHKVRCLVKVGNKKAAADTAFENRNEEELNFVLSKCGHSDRQLVESIKSMKQQLGLKR
ncbi:vacuolar protein sorting-associated protein 16 homolog isoform X1 [Mytilus californianus]|uniref:vacuolar protein sorting-associated protein 16 homolog isoform X1 n=1 Tax=Mytilus californianus TaxID=6549 RepID=UPI0022487003|nr:vacuolar protein sorting-associated protein 16 homolog isoform X1 [Mytilus californianus]